MGACHSPASEEGEAITRHFSLINSRDLAKITAIFGTGIIPPLEAELQSLQHSHTNSSMEPWHTKK